MRKLNKKGFTLVELLAVIIILGVLLLIAIPAMNSVIENAKKDAFVSTAKNYISQVRYEALQQNYTLPGPGQYNVVPVTDITLEKGTTENSTFDAKWKTGQAYVVIINDGDSTKDTYVYYFAGHDEKNNGMKLTEENAMSRSDVARGSLVAGDVATYSVLTTSSSASIAKAALKGGDLTCDSCTLDNYTYVGE